MKITFLFVCLFLQQEGVTKCWPKPGCELPLGQKCWTKRSDQLNTGGGKRGEKTSGLFDLGFSTEAGLLLLFLGSPTPAVLASP